MINYSLNDSGIFYARFSGKITFEDIKAYLIEFELLNYLPENVLLLYDLREADLALSRDNILSISDLTIKVTASYTSVRTAFVVSKPLLTAYTYLFTDELAPEKTVRKVFSTEKAAIEWLKE